MGASPVRKSRAALVGALAIPLALGPIAAAAPEASAAPGARVLARYHTSYGPGSFGVENTSTAGERISAVAIDLGSAMFPDILFDPDDGTPAGDNVGKSFTRTGGSVTNATGSQSEARQDGFETLTVATTGFAPGGDLKWAIDIDHSSVKGSSGTPAPVGGHISGGELHGALVTVTFEGGATRTGELVYDPASGTDANSRKASRVDVGGTRPAVTLARTSGPSPATVAGAAQQVVVSGPAGTPVRVVVAEGHMDLSNVPGNGFDVQPYEANSADGNTQNDPLRITQVNATIGAAGVVTVPVTLTRTASPTSRQSGLVTGLNYITAYAPSTSGPAFGHGPVSDPLVLKLDPSAGGPGDTTAPIVAGRLPIAGAAAIARGSNVVATFDEAVAPATITPQSVSLAPAAGGPPVAATLTLGSGNTVATLDPTADLAAGTQYRATITAAVTDAAGNHLAAPQSWTFTTAASPPARGSAAPGTAGGGSTPAPGCTAIRPTPLGTPRTRPAPLLTPAELRINRLTTAHAARRLAAIERWLRAGVAGGDICSGALSAAEFGPGVIVGATSAAAAPGTTSSPRRLIEARATRIPLTHAVTARMMRADRRAALAVRARAARIERLLARGLTGGDIRNGQITPRVLRSGLVVAPGTATAAIPAAAPAALRGRPAVRVGDVPTTARALVATRRIAVDALTRASLLRDRIRTGLGADEVRDRSLGASDLAPSTFHSTNQTLIEENT